MYLFLALFHVISLMSEKQFKSQTKSCKCHHGGQLDSVSLKLTDEFIRHFMRKQTECKHVNVLNLFVMNGCCCPHNCIKAGQWEWFCFCKWQTACNINCHENTGFFVFFYPWADSQHHRICILGVIFHLTFFNIKFDHISKDFPGPIPSVSSTPNGIVWDWHR